MDKNKHKVGLYESIITDSLSHSLAILDGEVVSVKTQKILPAEVGDRLALHLGGL
ncbi:hypothetical protein M0G74_02385 [Microbulbifer sp. CAU 1566]|uniref:hypothetical protein n=1 Tax=Microbulbifer sp. CAU 1566 TaxID=2933269 RepID=UPI00200464AD|nr:hypothetical protein [Microbulbifer sp. CAU 1566]MCK7596113.1 hypothetical protein [Microbulbifer sp. CAU 1566]